MSFVCFNLVAGFKPKTVGVFINLFKDFDTCDINIFLKKLDHYGSEVYQTQGLKIILREETIHFYQGCKFFT